MLYEHVLHYKENLWKESMKTLYHMIQESYPLVYNINAANGCSEN